MFRCSYFVLVFYRTYNTKGLLTNAKVIIGQYYNIQADNITLCATLHDALF